MKKFITALCTALVVVVLAFTLSGCSTYGKIEKAFVKNGYEVQTDVEKYQDKLLEALNESSEEDAKAVCTIHVLIKYTTILGIKTPSEEAFVFEFSSTDEMNKKIEESATLKGCTEFRLCKRKLRIVPSFA